MDTKIVMQVQGVDLDDFDTLEVIAQHLDDLGWESVAGVVSAVLYTDSPDPIAASLDAAHAIEQALPGSAVVRVDDQLVSIGDIADELGISSEAVRLWSNGKRRVKGSPFPPACAVVGKGRTTMKLWAWPAVLRWLRVAYKLDPEPGVRYLPAYDTARLNAKLARPLPGSDRWHTVTGAGCERLLKRVDDVLAEYESDPSVRPTARFMVTS